MIQDMSTTYRFKKQVTRNQQGSSLTLASLMSKLRSSLGAAWEQARSRLEYAYTHRTGEQSPRAISPKKGTYVRRLTKPASLVHEHMFIDHRTYVLPKALFLTVLMLVAITGAWGQDTPDYSGVYYIRSESTNKDTDGDYYLCPTKNWYLYKATNSYEDDTDDNDDNGQPFLTTYQCKDGVYDASKAVWDVVKHPTKTDCYYIIQRKTGRYMVSNGQIGSDANRMRVHLEAVADATALANLGDLALFEITSHGTHIDIVPHSSEGRNGDYIYLVVNFKNFNELKGSDGKKGGPNGTYGTNTAGIIGLYNQER